MHQNFPTKFSQFFRIAKDMWGLVLIEDDAFSIDQLIAFSRLLDVIFPLVDSKD